MARAPGLSVRLKLTLSYAGFLVVAGASLLTAVWVFLLRYVPDRAMLLAAEDRSLPGGVFPIRSELLRVFAPRAAAVMALLLVVGLVGGWVLAGRMLAPLTRITAAARTATTAPSAAVRMRRACTSNASPGGVSRMPRDRRSNRSAPSSRSRSWS